jgi:hypothetical protein
MNTAKSLSRAEVARRFSALKVDAWKDLSGEIDGCSVHAWATGSHRRIERVSVAAFPKNLGRLADSFRIGRALNKSTGLTTHISSVGLSATLNPDGTVSHHHGLSGPRKALP